MINIYLCIAILHCKYLYFTYFIVFHDNIYVAGASEDFPAFPTPGKLEFSHSSSQELSDLDINPEDNSSMAIEEVDMDD